MLRSTQGNDLDLNGKAGDEDEDEDSNENSMAEGGVGDFDERNGTKEVSHKPTHYKPHDDKDDWEWLLTSSTKTYACTGIFRSACWLLSEVGKPLLELMNQGYRLIITGHSLGELYRL